MLPWVKELLLAAACIAVRHLRHATLYDARAACGHVLQGMLTECWRHPYEYIYQYRRYVLVATPGTTPLSLG